jgi:hypothetical protein
MQERPPILRREDRGAQSGGKGTGASNMETTYPYVIVNVDSAALSGRFPCACRSQGFSQAEALGCSLFALRAIGNMHEKMSKLQARGFNPVSTPGGLH